MPLWPHGINLQKPQLLKKLFAIMVYNRNLLLYSHIDGKINSAHIHVCAHRFSYTN